jgi:cytochrome b
MTAARPAGAAAAGAPPPTIRVWDLLVRVLHWTLAASFAVAWLTAEESMAVHEAAGFVVLAVVAVRSLWGLIGPRHARFDDFVPGPAGLFAYVRDLAAGRARRFIGHNPAGGVMIVLLLSGLLATAATGVAMEYGVPGVVPPGEALEEVHEAAATAVLVLVGLHVTGVVVSSLLHRENLVRAMVTGRKPA